MDRSDNITQHPAGRSVLLHLLPGLLIGLCYFALVPLARQLAYPSIAALMGAVIMILVPFELGYLLFQGKKLNGRLSLEGVVEYRRKLPVWQYVVWVPVLFVLLGVIFTLMKPVDACLQNTFFSWIPRLDGGLGDGYSRNVLLVTYTLVGVLGVVVGPITEELYFRGYLLPRMEYAGRWAPLLHGFLFAVYHFWTPWMIPTRVLGTLPLVWAARQKSLYLERIPVLYTDRLHKNALFYRVFEC